MTNSISAQTTSPLTLADTLNQVINNITWSPATANSWTAAWGPILTGYASSSAIEAAIAQDINRGDYADALYVARIADINQYSSPAIQTATQTALLQLVMSKSLPGLEPDDSSLYGDPGPVSYELHQRYPLWGYTYAQNTPAAARWNLDQAFADFATLYNKPPINSAFGEMLWADPQSNWAKSYASRYYDECAETMSVFLIFAQQGVPEAMTYADRVWTGLQNHWTGQYYEYTVGSRIVECAMGEFAQIMAEYAKLKGGAQNVPNFNRVAQDLGYKLLESSWSSPGWSSSGILKHATTNSQTRLLETMAVTMSLQQFYPSFTAMQQSNYQNMLMGTNKAWQGLISSNVYFNGQFTPVGGATPSNDATICGAALLFLDGIVPITGTLNIPMREENYNDYRTQFLSSQFRFDYEGHQITIPINAGILTFIYGTAPVSYTFSSSGVYTIQFSNDWNTITAVNGVAVPPSAPAAPQNLIATSDNAQVTLSWAAPLSDGGSPVTDYRIYRGITSNSEELLATVGATTITYTDSSVINGQTYYYYVKAINLAGESSASNEVMVKPSESLKTLSITVSTDKAIYNRGSTAVITVTVKDSITQTPLPIASVTLKLTRNSQTVYTGNAVTATTGLVKFSYSISKTASKGTYQASATVTNIGYDQGNGQTTFVVK